jgi:hypothetical protein
VQLRAKVSVLIVLVSLSFAGGLAAGQEGVLAGGLSTGQEGVGAAAPAHGKPALIDINSAST